MRRERGAPRRNPQTLRMLVSTNTVPAGTELHHIFRDGSEIKARVTHGGAVIMGGETYASPSAAAEAIEHHSVNGWIYWNLPNGERLASVRES